MSTKVFIFLIEVEELIEVPTENIDLWVILNEWNAHPTMVRNA